MLEKLKRVDGLLLVLVLLLMTVLTQVILDRRTRVEMMAENYMYLCNLCGKPTSGASRDVCDICGATYHITCQHSPGVCKFCAEKRLPKVSGSYDATDNTYAPELCLDPNDKDAS